MGKINNRIIVSSGELYKFLTQYGTFSNEETLYVLGGYVHLGVINTYMPVPVEATDNFSYTGEGWEFDRLRLILKQIRDQPITIWFDSHMTIEGITI